MTTIHECKGLHNAIACAHVPAFNQVSQTCGVFWHNEMLV